MAESRRKAGPIAADPLAASAVSAPRAQAGAVRNLVMVLGDQLDIDSTVFEDFDAARDAVWMAEVVHESTQVPCSKPRIVMFLAAMRHFRDALRARGWRVEYRALDTHACATLDDALTQDLAMLTPERVIAVLPGEWRLAQSLPRVVEDAGVLWSIRPDRHFLCDIDDFSDWARGKRELRMEHFYRWIRKRTSVLMDGKDPVGGKWNFDTENRGAFGKTGPGPLPAPRTFAPDAVTREVIDLVNTRFAAHVGTLDAFDWPMTPEEAQLALADFIQHRLPLFGRYQDAMWTGEPWLYHARLSTSMNLKLLHPRVVIDAAVQAWRDGRAPVEAVEGFVRQVLGWREFVRGVYWHRMPGMLDANVLQADQPLPALYWTGRTHMRCLSESVGQTLTHGYAHHIQRLMVTGLFAQLVGVAPREIHAWYLAVYVDAVEWVELPNTLGMSQYSDGGYMVSKPYVASGRYVERMSNYCANCRYKPGESIGEDACPFTTLYWDFLARHEDRFRNHPRAGMQWRSLDRVPAEKRDAIAARAKVIRIELARTASEYDTPAPQR